jgi:hypothetical protein
MPAHLTQDAWSDCLALKRADLIATTKRIDYHRSGKASCS